MIPSSENIYEHLIAVTNRHLCARPFPEQIERVCRLHPRALILREKDLPALEYEALAARVMEICAEYEVPCILHSYPESAVKLGCRAIHMPLTMLEHYHSVYTGDSEENAADGDRSGVFSGNTGDGAGAAKPAKKTGASLMRQAVGRLHKDFDVIGVSVHSAPEAEWAEQLGATYLTAGHVFATGCKEGIPPRGLGFLRETAKSVSIPVYGIGGIGISAEQLEEILSCGAAGGCAMSAMMKI